MVTGATVPDFVLHNENNKPYRLYDLLEKGNLLLGFPGDIWELASIRRLLWSQREVRKLSLVNIQVAFVMPNEVTHLVNFHISTPLPVKFPLLADPDRRVHHLFNVTYPTLMIIDRNYQLRRMWMLQDGSLPRTGDIVHAAG